LAAKESDERFIAVSFALSACSNALQQHQKIVHKAMGFTSFCTKIRGPFSKNLLEKIQFFFGKKYFFWWVLDNVF